MSKSSDNTRASFAPKYFKSRGKWYARGWYPVRERDGSISRRRSTRGPGFDSRSECARRCDELNEFYEGRARTVKQPLTFARAVTHYIRGGGEARYLTEEIMLEIGKMECTDITDTTLSELAERLFQNGTPGTVNRELYTPVVAVLTKAAKSGHCPKPAFTRPKGHNRKTKLEVPQDDWFDRVLPQCRPQLRALLIFITLHGRRLGDALNAVPEDYKEGFLAIHKTKNSEPLHLEMSTPVKEAICDMYMADMWPRERKALQKYLFGYGPKAASNVRRDLRKACAAAGVKYYSPHPAGRHAFATRLLRAGYSLQYVKDAGHWKSERMVSERYGHLEQKEVTEAVHSVATNWKQQRDKASQSIVLPFEKKGDTR